MKNKTKTLSFPRSFCPIWYSCKDIVFPLVLAIFFSTSTSHFEIYMAHTCFCLTLWSNQEAGYKACDTSYLVLGGNCLWHVLSKLKDPGARRHIKWRKKMGRLQTYLEKSNIFVLFLTSERMLLSSLSIKMAIGSRLLKIYFYYFKDLILVFKEFVFKIMLNEFSTKLFEVYFFNYSLHLMSLCISLRSTAQ